MKIFYSTTIFLFIILFTSCTSSRPFSKNDIRQAQKLTGLHFADKHLDVMHDYLERNLRGYDSLRAYPIDYSVSPALIFNPLPQGFNLPNNALSCEYESDITISIPDNPSAIAFATIPELAHLIKTRQITSVQLTKIYLERIKKYDGILQSVITLMEDDALAQARKMDEELAQGKYRGPLHGIPYGIKDLAAVEGYPTTWGAVPFKDQVIHHTATIVKKMEASGAVLLAKLVSGALARGDVWFGGKTVCPWDTTQGASGSSAGSGAATSAGLVGFSIGTETMGSITSPSHRNGVTGLRPTYGRVSRDGFMSLSWSMDKVGPICRSAEGCAMVFQEISGKDPLDVTTYDVPFCYDVSSNVQNFKIGYLKSDFDEDTTSNGTNNIFLLDLLEENGWVMTPDSLPQDFPFLTFDIILRSEAGAFFDEITRNGKIDDMVQQDGRSRANSLRQSRFIPAVEYLQANRHRKLLIEKMHQLMSKYDVILSPTFGTRQLVITNLTGHPVITIPTGIDDKGHPSSITLIGNLFEEDKILRVAHAIQEMTDFDDKHPPMFR